MELFKVAGLVRSILKAKPETRDDDYLLWLVVMQEVSNMEHRPDFTYHMTVGDFLSVAKYSEYPSFFTVSRARRRMQAKHPELRATTETQMVRGEYEEQYRKYAKY